MHLVDCHYFPSATLWEELVSLCLPESLDFVLLLAQRNIQPVQAEGPWLLRLEEKVGQKEPSGTCLCFKVARGGRARVVVCTDEEVAVRMKFVIFSRQAYLKCLRGNCSPASYGEE